MISVVVYGRNDNHGYNAHRRVALSLNCLAEALSGPDDEILFTDYSTPDALPTLPEALSDTLTSRCRELLRVLRVRAATHEARFGETSLPIVESLARNVAIRRTNPANRWVLLTNTDMVIVPIGARTLGDICSTLEDRLYTIPRFELPEWLWEELPRSDPALVRSEIARLAADLRLDEATTSHDWLRYDCAGDFQLVPRADLFAIDALDERMTAGWHVDANLGQRMLLHRGSIESLAAEVAGYHCNHNRTTTVLQERLAVNDFHRFVVDVTEADVGSQRETWGLAESSVEEIRLDPGEGTAFRAAVLDAVSSSPGPPAETDARDEKWRLEYHSGHAFSFVADALRVADARARVAYLGVNETLRRMLDLALERLGRPELVVVEDELDATVDVIVVDLGIDSLTVGEPLATATEAVAADQRAALRAAFERFRRLVERERVSLLDGSPRRRFVLVGSSAVYWNAFTLAQLDVGPTTPHSGVRSATVKREPDVSAAARAAERRADQLWSWISRHDCPTKALRLRPGRTVELSSVTDYAGFGAGWGFPDRSGPAATGSRAELTLSEDGPAGAELELVLDRLPPDGAPVAHRGDEILDSTTSRAADDTVAWTIVVPPAHSSEGTVRLGLELPDGSRLLALRLARPGRGRIDQLARSLVQSRSGRTTPRH